MNEHKFAFDSRETYLEYRRDWKARYAKLSEAIRTNKRWMIAYCQNYPKRQFNGIGFDSWHPRKFTPEESRFFFLDRENNKFYDAAFRDLQRTHGRCSLSLLAQRMMYELKAAKFEAGRQWELSKK